MKKITVRNTTETRIDRFIRREYLHLPQSLIEKYLRLGKIRVNDKVVKSNFRLNNGDVVNINDNLLETTETSPKKATNFSSTIISLAAKLLNEYLISSCDEFIAVDKPPGLATQGGSKVNISIDHALLYLNETTGSQYRLVHRLDKDTSGVLIIAKNISSCISLGKAFKEKELQKTYIAVVQSAPSPSSGIIESYIGKEKSGTHEIVVETKNGKLAKTAYETISHAWKGESDYSLIKYIPQTGRMHQLRFHSKQLGCPILGDIKYGGRVYNRMMLHALEIKLPATIFGKEYVITAKQNNFINNPLQ